MQCQAMKPNRMQCTNKAFVNVDGQQHCRLDFSFLLGSKTDEEIAKLKISAINSVDVKDIKNMINTHKTATSTK